MRELRVTHVINTASRFSSILNLPHDHCNNFDSINLTNTNCIVYFTNNHLKPKILVIALFCRDVWLPTEKLSNMGVEVFQFHVDDVPSANIAPFFR